MVPGKIRSFLERANVAAAGSRDGGNRPTLQRVSGWSLGDDGETMRYLVPEPFVEGVLSSLAESGQVALTIEEIATHETYQFKGDHIDHETPTEADRRASSALRNRFKEVVAACFPHIPQNAAGAFIAEPALAVRFRVREIYLQTPGPGAGRRLTPPEAGPEPGRHHG